MDFLGTFPFRSSLIRLGFKAFSSTGAHNVLRPLTSGRGFILMLHRVSNTPAPAFNPNGYLTVQDTFLRACLQHIRDQGWSFVSLDEASKRIAAGDFSDPFCAITFDDGYHDNYEIAAPILRDFKAPFTVYTTTGFIDRTIEPWWILLEKVISHSSKLVLVDHPGRRLEVNARNGCEKCKAYEKGIQFLRTSAEADQDRILRAAAADINLDLSGFGDGLAMSWDEVKDFADDELASIGGHTVNHYALGRLSPEEARAEVVDGLNRLEEMTGKRPKHFCFLNLNLFA